MKYKFRLVTDKTTLAFSNSEQTLERIRDVIGNTDATIQPTRNGPRETIWVGPRTPVEIGGME